MKRRESVWFKALIAGGVILAVLLIVETVFTYRYSTTRFARDQALLQATENASSVEHQLRRERVDTDVALQETLDQVQVNRSDEVAWLRVRDANGEVQASSGPIETISIPSDRFRAVSETGRSYAVGQNTARGDVLVALLPIRGSSRKNWNLLEVAIYLRGLEGTLHPLRRDLLVSAVAAVALFAAMIILMFRLKAYVRERALADELQLARNVQRRLLPGNLSGCTIEFAGECLPADEVGGDFYDVFRIENGDIALVLADVSGKGLPAALRMGVVHGAIRALSRAENASMNPARMAMRLNELLLEKTLGEFVTLFLGFYNPEGHYLRYVNAGHSPPCLMSSTSQSWRRLETGGPVLGLLSEALYEEECIHLDGEDTLLAYSDGLIEATNAAGEEFGEARLVPLARAATGYPAAQILRQVMEEVLRFVNGGGFSDDLTVLVAKLSENDSAGARQSASS